MVSRRSERTSSVTFTTCMRSCDATSSLPLNRDSVMALGPRALNHMISPGVGDYDDTTHVGSGVVSGTSPSVSGQLDGLLECPNHLSRRHPGECIT